VLALVGSGASVVSAQDDIPEPTASTPVPAVDPEAYVPPARSERPDPDAAPGGVMFSPTDFLGGGELLGRVFLSHRRAESDIGLTVMTTRLGFLLGYGVTEAFRVDVVVPYVWNAASFDDRSVSDQGFSDVSLGLRYAVLQAREPSHRWDIYPWVVGVFPTGDRNAMIPPLSPGGAHFALVAGVGAGWKNRFVRVSSDVSYRHDTGRPSATAPEYGDTLRMDLGGALKLVSFDAEHIAGVAVYTGIELNLFEKQGLGTRSGFGREAVTVLVTPGIAVFSRSVEFGVSMPYVVYADLLPDYEAVTFAISVSFTLRDELPFEAGWRASGDAAPSP
jgi:hypothetical protein